MLKNKRKAFAAEYVKDWNATQAAVRAGYSTRTAYSQGQRLLKDVEVRAEIDRLSADIADQNDVEVREIIAGLRRIAFAPEGARVSNSDRLRALGLLGKYKAIFTDNVRQSGEGLSITFISPSQQTKPIESTEQPKQLPAGPVVNKPALVWSNTAIPATEAQLVESEGRTD